VIGDFSVGLVFSLICVVISFFSRCLENGAPKEERKRKKLRVLDQLFQLNLLLYRQVRYQMDWFQGDTYLQNASMDDSRNISALVKC